MTGMSFKTKGQEWFSRATGAVMLVGLYVVAIIGGMHLVEWLGPDTSRRNACECHCDGKVTP
jgi:hypothetical protein